MCGISGVIDFNKRTDQDLLQKMNRTLFHRGPDGEGYFMDNRENVVIGLGHRRLSIIDLTEGGKQPKSFQNVHITFNGEIYNYEEIKKTLEEKGHQFNTHSDTEVVLHAYKEWGIDALQKFIGMFAFVIYDQENQKVILCRDRAGVKPLFYYFKEGLFLFGSELKALLQHPGFLKEVNTDVAAIFMQYGYIPSPHCIFKSTFKLNPGHYAVLNISDKEFTVKQYWNVYDFYNKPRLKISLPEAIEETEKILTSAFQYRMVSDVPVGVFLSGGYDSTCVAALLQKNTTEKIKTFTIGVYQDDLNEAPYAKQVAEHLGTDHTEYYCTEKEALQIVPDLAYFYDEPFADSSAIPTTLVSKIAKQKVTVALSADAGDEIFCGYNRYDIIANYTQKIKSLPAFLRKSGAAVMEAVPASAIPYFNKKYLFEGKYEKLKAILKNASDKNVILSLTQQVNDKGVADLFKNPVSFLQSAFDSEEFNSGHYDALSYTMAIDYQTYLPDDILQKVDRATMSVSLEGREPFLDQRVIEFAAQLPLSYKYNNGKKKIILKDIVHKYVSEKIMDRPKMGFVIPIRKWLLQDLKPYADKYFDEKFIEQQNIFNYAAIKKMMIAFYDAKTERVEKVWFLLMFQMWYDKWINNN